MTDLRIENQNSNVEIVSAAIILKLYNLALGIEENLEEGESLSDYVSLKGNLLADHAKLSAYNYLTGNLPDSNTKRFPELSINVTDGLYINFTDPEVERVLLANNIGDGVGITTAMAAAKSGEMPAMFRGNTTITSFDELALFGWNRIYCKTNTTASEGAFYNCTNLVSIDLDNIVLPSGNSTYKHAFANCTSLTTVKNMHFSPQVGTFLGCTSLQSIDLSESVWIGNSSFSGCTSLTTVTWPTNLFTIGAAAFLLCSSLTSADLTNCTSIGGGSNNQGSLQDCSSLSSITWPAQAFTTGVCAIAVTAITSADLTNCTALASYTFSNCALLSTVTWPALNFTMADNVFRNTNLTGPITISYLTSIGLNAFEGTKLTVVDFSGCTFTSFPINVFKNVTTLTKVVFPTTLTTIGLNNSSFNLGINGSTYTVDIYGLDNVTTYYGGIAMNTNVGNAVCLKLLEHGVSPIRNATRSTTTVKLLYFPKLKYSTSNVVTTQTYAYPNTTMFNYDGWEDESSNINNRHYIKIGLLYFKDLETIHSVMFYGARPKNLVINNITPPQFTQSTYTTNGFNNSFTLNSNFTEWDTKPFGVIPYNLNDSNCMIIYVPDSAVATYQANSLYNMYTIRGINEVNPSTNQPYLTRYATNALWEAAGRPDDALIEEYM